MPGSQTHINVIFVGPQQSGKTELFTKISEQTLAFSTSPYEFFFDRKLMRAWDETYDSSTPLDYSIWVYCVDLSITLDETALIRKLNQMKQHKPFDVLLVGTKDDVDGASIRFDQLKHYVAKLGLTAVSTSVKKEQGPKEFISSLNSSIHKLSFSTSEKTFFEGLKINLDRVPSPASIELSLSLDPLDQSDSATQEERSDETVPSPTASEERGFEEPNPSPIATQSTFREAANLLRANLKQFPNKCKKIMTEVKVLKRTICHTEKSDAEKRKALEDFHNKSLAILNHKHHPALKALLAFTAFVFCTVAVAAIGFCIMGLVTGIWAPAIFIAALTAAQPAAIVVVSSAAAAGLTTLACTTYGLFKAPKPTKVQEDGLQRFVDTETIKLDSVAPAA